MDTYTGLFTELKRSTVHVRRRHRKGLLDSATQDAMYAKLAAMYNSLDRQPLYQALVLLNKARMDHATGRSLAEAAAYIEAGKRFLAHEMWQVAQQAMTTEEHVHMALAAFDSAIEVYQLHGMNTEAGAIALSVARRLCGCHYNPIAADWYLFSADLYSLVIDSPSTNNEIGTTPLPATAAVVGAIQALDGAADMAVETGDMEMAISALEHQLSYCVRCEAQVVFIPIILQSSISLALALLVQKRHTDAKSAVNTALEYLEGHGFFTHNLPNAADGLPPLAALTGPNTMGVVQAMPLLNWLQEECEVQTDIPTIECLCQQLMAEVAYQGERNMRLLLYIPNVYRNPAYIDTIMHASRQGTGSPAP